uniref:Intraflagellar transport protein 56 n=2 Tax=Choreotrichia TaxID=141411 RepID=A0A7S3S006_9SPIT|mmetsp:Transcript_16885/g.23304  ORF Transcript_16885/g.23304 Transcript_16885/m.23304 type:complete len:579 (+) Transcript_16885:118-1854(+)
MSHLRRNQKEKERRKVPDLHSLLEARDYTGAITLIEFNRKVFLDAKHTSGWREGANGFDWVEGSRQALTEQERKDDEQQCLWLAYAAFHLGDYKKALDTYQGMIDRGSLDQMLYVYMGCCLLGLGWYAEAEEKAQQGPACPLQNRLLFHISHRINDETKLMSHHQQLADTTLDQLSLASIHYLRNHFQEATDIYKRLLLENRDYAALNVYVALCYYKLDYYDVSLEILAAYLQAFPDSAIALNLKACNQFRLYDGKAALDELAPLTREATSIDKIDSKLVRHNMVVFQNGERALQVLPQLVDVVPEARLNLVIYHMQQNEVQEAFELMKDIEPTSPQEYILKGVTNLALGQQLDSREHLKVAQQYFQLLGASASECDTIPGRQCMASCFFILRQFDDVLIYLSSIEAYFPNDVTFHYNYSIAKAAAGKYSEAEPLMLALASGSDAEALSRDFIFQMWLARVLVMNGKARQAWELYLKIEGTQESFAMLQLLANDCYRAGAFLYAAKAFETLERLDPNPEYWEGKRGACVGAFQQIIAQKERKETLREVVNILKSTRNPQVEYLTRVIKKWARDNDVIV